MSADFLETVRAAGKAVSARRTPGAGALELELERLVQRDGVSAVALAEAVGMPVGAVPGALRRLAAELA